MIQTNEGKALRPVVYVERKTELNQSEIKTLSAHVDDAVLRKKWHKKQKLK